jgi:hypothetical protein
MILRLVKRDPAWQMTRMLAVMVVIAVAAPLGFSKVTIIPTGDVALLVCPFLV